MLPVTCPPLKSTVTSIFLSWFCPINCIASKVAPICNVASDKLTQTNLSVVIAIPAAIPKESPIVSSE